ncbi:MAG: prepilin-type N-terminal cleavage/methylation domain-containing protein [Candidatus Omnitrophica bacterium]|nr:prepilin-type N-terminal cleavage/methylation domain-containing protein [Candidatus Omnitrophota bacterium]MCF7894429.1 prepilin-type N-terminal cleavage/methylation domain-containing protein [Candidatus Omnitrophota bacterium]
MKKGMTLIELLVALLLISIVILAVFGIYNASSSFFNSSGTKSKVLNDLIYVLDHIDKNVYLSTGWVNNPAIVVTTPTADSYRIDINQDINQTPINFSDDQGVRYEFNPTANTIRFADGSGNWKNLTNKLIDPNGLSINYNPTTGVLSIDNLCLRQDVGQPSDPKTNPDICITSQNFSTFMQSLN